jgi:enterochelin esterase-like enzyme
MQRDLTSWLARGLVVSGLVAIVALWVLVKPISAPAPTATPTPNLTPSPTPFPTFIPIPTWTSTPAPAPTPLANATLTPTFVPTIPPGADAIPPLEADATMTDAVALAGRIEQHTYPSQVSGSEESYRIYLPPGYDQDDRRYPVLYLLHGWPYEAADWENLGAARVADAGIVNGTLPPFIIVIPRGSEALYVNTSGGDYSFEGQLLKDLIPHVDATYRTWPAWEARAIGGISRGGVWALEIAFRNPSLFSVVGAHSPALSMNLAPPVYDPFNLLETPAVASLRIYLDSGDVDWTGPSTRSLHERLDGHGIANQFVVHSGGHDRAMWSANMAEYIAFYTAGWIEFGGD